MFQEIDKQINKFKQIRRKSVNINRWTDKQVCNENSKKKK